MDKYRIIKKTDVIGRDCIYPELFEIEAKGPLSLFWSELVWWPGTDISDKRFSDADFFNKVEGFPHPFKETCKKFKNDILEYSNNTMRFKSMDAAMFFLGRVKAQEAFMEEFNKRRKHKAKASQKVIYSDTNPSLKKEEKQLNIIDL